jgi:hypothetical protein
VIPAILRRPQSSVKSSIPGGLSAGLSMEIQQIIGNTAAELHGERNVSIAQERRHEIFERDL